jgi:uncharacterized protein (TIGR00369 family)
MVDDTLEYTRHLNIEDIGIDEQGRYQLRTQLTAIHLSRAKLVHGGMIFSMLDAAMGRAAMHHFDNRRFCPTVEIKINYFRPAAAGELRAWGLVINSSRHLCYVVGEVQNEAGKRIARASGTFFVKPPE